MKKKNLFLGLGITLSFCMMSLLYGGANLKTDNIVCIAEETKSYSTENTISEQGQNGFYYAWGKKDKYALMTYGATRNGSLGWHGIEDWLQTADGYLTPGNFCGCIIIWVANESGTVQLNGVMEKCTIDGDGVNLGVYHQTYDGALETLLEKFVSPEGVLEYPLNQTINVAKGDTLLFYCDSGLAKSNTGDAVRSAFTITYLSRAGDMLEGDDLSMYLYTATPTEISGTQETDWEFEAEVLDGTLVESSSNTGCSSSVSTLVFLPMMIVPLLLSIRRKES